MALMTCSVLPSIHHLPAESARYGFPTVRPFKVSASAVHLGISHSSILANGTSKSLAISCSASHPGNAGGSGAGSGGGNRKFGGGDGGEWFSSGDKGLLGLISLFINGWKYRVTADPQFPFKVLMEELVGVSASVLGDMSSRPYFGLRELDFVFSTLVVGSIVNFVLMYLLAPTAAGSSAALPAIFASCPKSHMFEAGTYSILDRLGTLVYKGALFGAVGLASGLVGTAISNRLVQMRKKKDPNFATSKKSPPTLLNALTWAIHMGVSSNLRYQCLNIAEFLLEKRLPSAGFKASVILLRCLNNVFGGFSFVVLARITGAQQVDQELAKSFAEDVKQFDEKVKQCDEEVKPFVVDEEGGESSA